LKKAQGCDRHATDNDGGVILGEYLHRRGATTETQDRINNGVDPLVDWIPWHCATPLQLL